MGKDIPVIENKNNSRVFLLPLIIMSVLAVALFSFFNIDRSIWFDEAHSVLLTSHDHEGIINAVKKISHPPLYHLFLALWTRAFGMSELAVRSPSSIFYILSLVAIYVLGKSIYNDKRTGLLCSFLYMLSPLAIIHAQNARPYSLLGLLAILSTLFFSRLFLIKTNSKKDLVLYIIVNIIGTFTHFYFFFVILSQIVSYILLFSRTSLKTFCIAIFLSLMPFLVLWSPIFLSQVERGVYSWISKPGFHALVSTFRRFYGGNSAIRAALVYAAFLALIVFKVEGFKIRFWNISTLKEFIIQKQNLAFLIFFAISLLVPFIISQVKPIYVPTRYTIIALPPFVVVIGSLLSRFGNKHVVLAFCYILLIEATISFVSCGFTPKQYYSDKSTTKYLITHAHDNDIIIFTGWSRAGIDYYLRLMKPNNTFTTLSFLSDTDKRKHVLESKVDNFVRYLDTLIIKNKVTIKNNDTKIWLLYGCNPEVGNILKNRLDTRFFLSREINLRKLFHPFNNNYTSFEGHTYYNKIFVYQK
ncbi:MAG TPA: glycosyltransferase family 39 protein [Candidatus Brocadiia bacterium]|nr:glycosyltransferase family 39 protein [Candidatus Brocadiales bacterium]